MPASTATRHRKSSATYVQLNRPPHPSWRLDNYDRLSRAEDEQYDARRQTDPSVMAEFWARIDE